MVKYNFLSITGLKTVFLAKIYRVSVRVSGAKPENSRVSGVGFGCKIGKLGCLGFGYGFQTHTRTRHPTFFGCECMVIIDEISMISYEQFREINLRLQQLKEIDQFFGGVNIILMGDLMQLQPVNGHWIFE